MEDQNILIDQLEDKLIDHPPKQAVSNTSGSQFDESYQKDLNERASQILNGTWGQLGESNYNGGQDNTSFYNFLLTRPLLHYQHKDVSDLRQELANWFVSSDWNELSSLKVEEPLELDAAALMGFHPSLNLSRPNYQIDQLCYYILGSFKESSDESTQLAQIVENSTRLINHELTSKVFTLYSNSLKKYCASAEEYVGSKTSAMETMGVNIHKLATVLYVMLTVAHDKGDYPNLFLETLREADIIAVLVQTIEAWKQHPTNVIKVRSLFSLLYKLILVEFGDSDQLSKVESLLAENLALPNSEGEPLTCSPLEYFTFKEDMHDKYPLSESYISKKAELDSNLSEDPVESDREEFMALNFHSNSMTNLLETPRTNKAHTVMGQLPTPTLHLSTPVTSPPSTPSEFMSGGEKIRKMYHVHQGMPLLYPFEELQTVPQAVLEADRLLDKTARESYSFKQFYQERLAFMKQERGIESGYESVEEMPNLKTLTSTSLSQSEIERCRRSLNRVENFYSTCMLRFRSLVEVMVSVIASNKLDVNLRDIELEINSSDSFLSRFGADSMVSFQVKNALFRKLESIRAKDVTLKAVSGILIFLLRWLKASHILKSFYFGTVMLDAGFLTVFMDFISDSFNNNALQKTDNENLALTSYEILSAQNKLLNPRICLPQFDFFNLCLGQNEPPAKVDLVNSTPICRMKHEIDDNGERIVHINDFNEEFCAILTNLFSATNEILIENMSQRVIMFNETKPTDLMKIILLNFENKDLQTPILKVFKKLTPYQGRKWRASNMDVISRIYMNLRLSLKDDWLCGKDLESDLNSCYEQESALRSLLQFYNIRQYADQMRCLGLSRKQ